MMKIEKDENTCWACKRTLIDKSKTGLCPECTNKYGTCVVAVGILGMGVLTRKAVKHSGKAVKVAVNMIKRVR